MDQSIPTIALESELNLRNLFTTGSVLHINDDYIDQEECQFEIHHWKGTDVLGEPVKSFEAISKQFKAVDDDGLVRKKILVEGGGLPIKMDCTVSISYCSYWEAQPEPFDSSNPDKPLVINLQDSGLLPGLLTAVQSMLVGETAVFLLSYKVMYGELGLPPRIKPKQDCIFYVRLIKSFLAPPNGYIDFSQPNMFQRVNKEVTMLYIMGMALHKAKNFPNAIQQFRKAINMLHKTRLADEKEEKIQEKLLVKLYMNLAVCYNKTKQPLKTCIACNELNRLNKLWNNKKALFQNAKALKMIGQFADAEKKLKRAEKLCPGNEEIEAELALLKKARNACNQLKLLQTCTVASVSDNFKEEVNNLIKNFKENDDLCKLILPEGLNNVEIEYIKEKCGRQNLFCHKFEKSYSLDKDGDNSDNNIDILPC